METDDFAPFRSEKEPNIELNNMYNIYREPFINFARQKYFFDLKVYEDAYQESFIALWHEIHTGKLTSENRTASVKTYLFRKGLNKLYKILVKQINDSDHFEKLKIELELFNTETPFLNEETKAILQKEIMELGEPCSQLLSLYFYERKRMKEIAGIVGYKSEDVAKNKKHWCMELLIKNCYRKQYTKGDFHHE